jgi:PleD family two-component response regulator
LRFLACTVPGVDGRIAVALAGEQVHFVRTVEEAMHALTHVPFDLVIIGMLFDESRGLELLRRIRANSSFGKVAVAGVRGAKLQRRIPPEAFDVPMLGMGACDVIDLAAIAPEEAGDRELRERLIRCTREPNGKAGVR